MSLRNGWLNSWWALGVFVVLLLVLPTLFKYMPWIGEVVFLLCMGGVLVLVYSVMTKSGWSTLARNHREVVPFKGRWLATGIAQISPVSASDPKYDRKYGRFFGTLRMGTTAEAVYLSTIFSDLPLLQKLFPPLQIPWSAMTQGRVQDTPGVEISLQDGSISKSKWIELQVGEPPVFLQPPAELLADFLPRIPFAPHS